MPIDWTPFKRLVAECDTFVLTSHTRPDCDAVGSELGMALALESLGKRARIVNGDVPPDHIAFLDPEGRVEVIAGESGGSVAIAEVHAADCHLILDTGAWGQLGAMADVLRASPARRAVIDHHVSGDDLGAALLKDTAAEATGRLVLDAIDALGVKLTAAMAQPLLAAIATDTGWFRFPSVTAQTFEAAARLIAAGATPSDLYASLYDQNTAARVRLHGRIMESLALELGGAVAVGQATHADFAATGAVLADTEDVVNRLLSVEGVKVAVLVAEMDAERCKASLRSRSDVDVREVAEQFGGGGHTKAAGVRVRGDAATATATLLDALRTRMG
ncbi:MAG: DHH family phosphoesterase [Lacipirellulaceae bacterium]